MPSRGYTGKLCILCMYLDIEWIVTPHNAPRNDYKVLVDRLYWQWCISALKTIVGAVWAVLVCTPCLNAILGVYGAYPTLPLMEGGTIWETLVPVY